MRVISGFLKSRKLLGDNIDGTRPTMDRVKTSLFAIINKKIQGSTCLDLFAGSGQLGIEAISNGAKKTVFCDANKKCIDVINKNITNLKIDDKCKVLFGDYIDVLNKLVGDKFDIIFLDPPYKMNVVDNILKYISKNNMLNEDGIVVVEYSDVTPEDNIDYEVVTERKYGNKYIRIYRCIR